MQRGKRLVQQRRLQNESLKVTEVQAEIVEAERMEINSNVDGKDLIVAGSVSVPNAAQIVEKLSLYAPLDQPTFDTQIRIIDHETNTTFSLGVEKGNFVVRRGEVKVLSLDF